MNLANAAYPLPPILTMMRFIKRLSIFNLLGLKRVSLLALISMRKIPVINTILAAAAASLRGQYARDVVTGKQRWSGSDLKGKARKYGHTYYIQRRKARAALFAAGGCIIAIDHGLNVSAVRIDAGNYMTARGVAVRCGTRYKVTA